MDYEEETTLSETYSEGEDVTPADSEGTGSEVEGDTDTGSTDRKLDPRELQKTVNRLFNEKRDLETKIASLEGRQTPQNDLSQEIGKLKSELSDTNNRLNQSEFYAKYPQYNTEEIRGILGNDPQKSLESKNIKGLVDKAVAFDEQSKSKSVLMSNPRLGKVTDKMAQAREAIKSGNDDSARRLAVESVLDAFEQ